VDPLAWQSLLMAHLVWTRGNTSALKPGLLPLQSIGAGVGVGDGPVLLSDLLQLNCVTVIAVTSASIKLKLRLFIIDTFLPLNGKFFQAVASH
jgi:hypothetical protein